MAGVDAIDGDMRSRSRPRAPKDQALAVLAAGQHGVVARSQLRAAGLGQSAIDHRVRSGRLHVVHAGVYAVGQPRLPARGDWMAAVLACGRGAVLSHSTAAALWGIRASSAARVDVTVARRGAHHRRGIRVHAVRDLDPEDRAQREQIPITSVARTLLDLAEVLQPQTLSRAFEEAERLELLDLRAIERLWVSNRGRHGLRRLRLLLDDARPANTAVRSELERLFLDLCHEAGLPMPTVNVVVEGFEVDAFWPDAGLVVELDGHQFHRSRSAFERDRARDAALLLAGYRVLRITHRRLKTEPEALERTVRSLLARE